MSLSSSLRKIDNSDKFRENIRGKLNELIQNEKQSMNLEKGIFNYSLNEAKNRKIVKKWDNPYFIQIYVDRLRSIFINIKNPILLEQLQSGTLKSHSIAFMSHQEMAPDKWQHLIEIKSKRDMNKFESNLEAATDTFTCRKCKSNKCTYYQQQVRSADEPMTTFVQCISCGNRWKC
uniref:TFIIS-type domain-containing protein n=1 Tax=viral metagenome TaxID=1070528 RepID=A0A6C0DJD9_9ZZZZ